MQLEDRGFASVLSHPMNPKWSKNRLGQHLGHCPNNVRLVFFTWGSEWSFLWPMVPNLDAV